MRIGKDGAFVDNSHAGGRFTSINLKTGELGDYVCNQYGTTQTEWNGIDYSRTKIRLPYWNDVIEFAQMVGRKVLHHRMLALDIAIRANGKPILIEYNIDQFSYWLFQYAGQEVFDRYTEEIVQYCLKTHKNDKRK